MSTLVNSRGRGQGVKIGSNLVHVVVEWPLTPFLKTISLLSRRFFSEKSVLMYGYYSKAACNHERVMMSRIR